MLLFEGSAKPGTAVMLEAGQLPLQIGDHEETDV